MNAREGERVWGREVEDLKGGRESGVRRRVEKKASAMAGTVQEGEKVGFFLKRALQAVLEEEAVGFHGVREREGDEGGGDVGEMRLKKSIDEGEIAGRALGKWGRSEIGGGGEVMRAGVVFNEGDVRKMLRFERRSAERKGALSCFFSPRIHQICGE